MEVTSTPVTGLNPILADCSLLSFGSIKVPAHPLQFGFQLDLVPTQNECRQVVFALVSPDSVGANRGAVPYLGFAVRVDLETGEVWDVLNNGGFLGWVERDMATFSDEVPMLLSWKVEHCGAALLPTLEIGNDQFLYPSIRCVDGMIMNPSAGCEEDALEEPAFLNPAVWAQCP